MAAGAVLAWGCASAQTRCGSLDACSATAVCEVGRCVPAPEPPVAETTRRLVLAPVALRYVDVGARSDGGGSSCSAPAFAIGRAATGGGRSGASVVARGGAALR